MGRGGGGGFPLRIKNGFENKRKQTQPPFKEHMKLELSVAFVVCFQ